MAAVRWFRGRVVTPGGVWEQGLLQTEGDRITGLWDLRREVGPELYRQAREQGALPAGGGPLQVGALAIDMVQADDGYICPGFVDVHVHGGAGADFMDADPEAVLAICRFHARHGTTGLLATTLTAPPAEVCAAIAAARAAMGWGAAGSGAPGEAGAGAPGAAGSGAPGARVLGFHVEGPFINPEYRGAQALEHIRLPSVAEAEAWLAAGLPPGAAAWQVTLAPERPGALDLIRHLHGLGVLVSAGHTGCTYADMQAAHAAGLSGVTHAYNAMRPLHHREAGALGAALDLPDLTAELICDGHHVAAAPMRILLRARGYGQVVLVTDAMRAAGQPDGRYRLGGLEVQVRDGTATLVRGGQLAGSLLTMDRAVGNLHRLAGVPVHQAVAMASLNPARRLGLAGRKGSLEVGKDADVVVLDRDCCCRLTLVGGQVAFDGR